MLDQVIAYHRRKLETAERARENENRMYPDYVVAAAPGEIATQLELLAALERAQTLLSGDHPLWKHRKRGSVYQEVGTLIVQCAAPVEDGDVLTLYRGEADGMWFGRPPEEFRDGRFISVEARTSPRLGLAYFDTSVSALFGSKGPFELPAIEPGKVRIKLRSAAHADFVLELTSARWAEIAQRIARSDIFTLDPSDAPEDYCGDWCVLDAISMVTGDPELHVRRA